MSLPALSVSLRAVCPCTLPRSPRAREPTGAAPMTSMTGHRRRRRCKVTADPTAAV